MTSPFNVTTPSQTTEDGSTTDSLFWQTNRTGAASVQSSTAYKAGVIINQTVQAFIKLSATTSTSEVSSNSGIPARVTTAFMARNTIIDSQDGSLERLIRYYTQEDSMNMSQTVLQSQLYNNSIPSCNTTTYNGTCFNGTFVNGSTASVDPELRYWTLILVVVPLLTFFGNSLVVLSVYREKSLQFVTNYFIVSLAIADILVAVLVMPLAVYSEVMDMKWDLGDYLCDAWVSCDVMACTASILNLTAISIDRFMAVTTPIYYAKHKNSNRVYITLALVWVTSLGIALPIATGQNTSPQRTSDTCTFWNSDFLIVSSLISFYIPCVIMLLLYGRIFMVIRSRGRKSAMAKMNALKDNRKREERGSDQSLITPMATPVLDTRVTNGCKLTIPVQPDQVSISVAGSSSSTNEGDCAKDSRLELREFPLKTSARDKNKNVEKPEFNKDINIRIKVTEPSCPNLGKLEEMKQNCHSQETLDGSSKTTNESTAAIPDLVMKKKRPSKGYSSGKGIHSYLRNKKKKEDRLSNKRERKATKTLAIVLGVFLLCWVPFFTVNIINAICIRYKLPNTGVCGLQSMSSDTAKYVYGLLVWLGYMNSFMNPVIYTIFNMEFRKAFKKVLGLK